jgi:hypothetical protein
MGAVVDQTGSDDAGQYSESHDLDALVIDQPSRLFKRGIVPLADPALASPRGEPHVEKSIAKCPLGHQQHAPAQRPIQRPAVSHWRGLAGDGAISGRSAIFFRGLPSALKRCRRTCKLAAG